MRNIKSIYLKSLLSIFIVSMLVAPSITANAIFYTGTPVTPYSNNMGTTTPSSSSTSSGSTSNEDEEGSSSSSTVNTSGGESSSTATQKVHSLIGELFMPVFNKTLTNGDIIFKDKDRANRTVSIINGTAEKTYSLYDLYGPDVSFYEYLGEKKIETNLIDNVYTYVLKHKNSITSDKDIKLTEEISEIADLFKKKDFVSNNQVYVDRVDIVNSREDPRYLQYLNGSSGIKSKNANFQLSIAKVLFDIQVHLIDDSLMDAYDALYENLFGGEDSPFTVIATNIFSVLSYLLIIAGIIIITIMGVNYLKGNSGTLWNVILKAGSFMFAYAFILIFIAKPAILYDALKTINSGIEAIYEEAVSVDNVDNDVVNGSENLLEASLWYVTIFDSWCKGEFGKSYDKMYTLYSGMDADHCLKMSDNSRYAATEGEVVYSTKETVKDVVVKNGGNGVRNWAALAYSCLSIYHLDAEEGNNANGIKVNGFPQAYVTINNSEIYIDDFRIVDALMNISNSFNSRGEVTNIIPKFGDGVDELKTYQTGNMMLYGWIAVLRVLLLIPITYLSIMVFMKFVEMTLFIFSFLFDIIKNFFNTKRIGENFDSLDTFKILFIQWIMLIIGKVLEIELYMRLYDSIGKALIFLLFSAAIIIEMPGLKVFAPIKDKANLLISNKINKYVSSKSKEN